MAVVVVQDSNLRLEDMETTPTNTNIGGGGGGALETDFFYQGANCFARKTGSGDHGFWITDASTTDFTAAGNEVLMLKAWLTNFAAMNTNGFRFRIGGDQSNFRTYFIAQPSGARGDNLYQGSKDLWMVKPINPTSVYWGDLDTGTPVFTAVDEYALTANVGSSKAANNGMDALDVGPGLWLYGGTSTDPDGTWDDFLTDDFGSITAGRFGHLFVWNGQIFAYGGFVIGENNAGTAQGTVFTDRLKTITFPGGRVNSGWNKVEIELAGTGTGVIAHNNFTFKGNIEDDVTDSCRDGLKRWFDTEFDVDGTNDEVDIEGTDHGYQTGQAIRYSNEGGTETIGLTNNTVYFVRRVNAVSVSFHTSRDGAYTNTVKVNLTASGTNNAENHSLTREPDTRPDFIHTGTTPGTAVWTDCVWENPGLHTGTSAVTYDGCRWVRGRLIDLVGAALTDCFVDNMLTTFGVAGVKTNDLADISGSDFTRGADGLGHAIEITVAGTYSFVGNTFNGFFTSDSSTDGGVNFNTAESPTGNIDSTNDEIDITGHPWSTGDTVYYNDDGGVQNIGLTDDTLYYVRSVTANSISLHETEHGAQNNTNKINLTAGGSETHKLYSAQATILNSSGGLVTINVSGGDTPTVRNTGAGSVSVQTTVTLKVTVKDQDGSPVENAQTAIYALETVGDVTKWDELLSGTGGLDTNASGVAQNTGFNYPGSDISVEIRVRKASTGATKYEALSTPATVTSTGLDVTVAIKASDIIS